jgi:hypothetical protein
MAGFFNPLAVEKFGGYSYQDVEDFTDNVEEFFDINNTTDTLLRYKRLTGYKEGPAKAYLQARTTTEQADWSALVLAFRAQFSSARRQNTDEENAAAWAACVLTEDELGTLVKVPEGRFTIEVPAHIHFANQLERSGEAVSTLSSYVAACERWRAAACDRRLLSAR